MRPHKVLYVEMAHSLGGSVVSLYQLVRGLDRSRYEPVVLFYWDFPYIERFRELGVETLVWAGPRREGDPAVPMPLPSALAGRRRWLQKVPWIEPFYHGVGYYVRFLLQTLPLAWRIQRLIRARGIELVHANDLVGANREAIIAAKLTRRPCLCHIRAFERYTRLDRFLLQFVDYFVFISRAIATSCIAQGVEPAKGTVVYNALDLLDFLPAFDNGGGRERLGLKPDDKVVGIIGRIVPWKGQEVFIRAMAQVAASVPNLRCLVVGDAASSDQEYKERLKALVAELGLADRVSFLSWRDDIPQLLSVMDVLVHASLEPEPFGRVLIEGMAAAKPVVAANAGASSEIIEDGVSGLLVPPGDAEALARAVIGLLADPDRMRTMGLVARHQVEMRFSIERHVAEIQNIYERLLEKSR